MTNDTPPTDRSAPSRTTSLAHPSRRRLLKAAGAGAGLFALGAGPGTASAHQHSYNLASALNKSLYFFDANRCGPDAGDGRLAWRGACHDEDAAVPLEEAVSNGGTDLSSGFISQYSDILDPDGTGTVDVSGGFHDAGDHVKFGLPQSFSASNLAWAVLEFEDAFRDVGSYDHILHHLHRFAEYFLKCIFRDDSGEVVAFCYQVSNGGGSFDHNYWGPPEEQDPEQSPRPAYFATADDPASDRSAAAAAALAVISLVLESEDPDYAAECLDAAEALYAFADEHRGVPQTAAPYYESTNDADHLCWAAIWLHEATGEDAYLEDAAGVSGDSYTGHVSDILTSVHDDWHNTWVQSWDSVWSGVFLKLYDITGEERWRELAFWNLAYWSGGEVSHEASWGDYIQTTPAGFSFLNEWGSARYNAAAQFMATVYRNYTGNSDVTDWALGQMEYIMGDNPFGYSLIVGFTDSHAERPHHDAAHGTDSGMPSVPPEHEYTLYGALVGGPDASDNHIDDTADYTLNEVAIDFNTGLVGALAGLYTYYGEGDEPRDFLPDEYWNEPDELPWGESDPGEPGEPGDLDVTGDGNPAQDLTGDGLYEDVTGDGNLGFNDVVTFFEEHNGDVVQSNVEYFDFSGSGSVGFNDVVSLFERL
ncbi:glycoside hydrolase family 9 protein [Natronobiforma cellulositropha]|uniref:glycoside hydrolase family 9 protein n=1 Tax=Natronobiforma cellulositropha TaxID=1679076 RepID=UPI0021D5E874|nr:glycoside hydrolase family 9 protein [Natronobiforma cellulositropha]